MFINGARRGSLMEDTQVPNGDTLESVFPDDPDGDLFKISIWNEFGLTGQALGVAGISEAYLNNYTTTGGAKKRARYRWNFAQRSIHGTANDFTNLYTLVNAVTTPAARPYVQNLNAIADMENWMRSFAVEHAVGNWDSFGYRNHQNMFAYKPEHDRWSLLIWDINIVFGGGTRGAPIGTNGDLLEIDSADFGHERHLQSARISPGLLAWPERRGGRTVPQCEGRSADGCALRSLLGQRRERRRTGLHQAVDQPTAAPTFFPNWRRSTRRT